MLGNFFMFLIAGYLQIPLDILEPSPTTLDLQASTHNPLHPQTLDPRPTTPSTHNNISTPSNLYLDASSSEVVRKSPRSRDFKSPMWDSLQAVKSTIYNYRRFTPRIAEIDNTDNNKTTSVQELPRRIRI